MTSGITVRPSAPSNRVDSRTDVRGSCSMAAHVAPLPMAMAGTDETGELVLTGEQDIGDVMAGGLRVGDGEPGDADPISGAVTRMRRSTGAGSVTPIRRTTATRPAAAIPMTTAYANWARSGRANDGRSGIVRENVPLPVHASRPMKTRLPTPEARSPGSRIGRSIGPLIPAASMSRKAPASG